MRIFNKKAKFNYHLLERFEAGLSLKGSEVKSLKMGRADLSNSFVKIIGGEAYLLNANIPVGKEFDSARTRKVLLHKNEIVAIGSKIKQKKLTLIPTKLYTKGRLVKLEVALAKAKRTYEKKEAIKRRDIERELEQELKNRKT